MNAADHYRYSNRAAIDTRIEAMKDRIIAERRAEIGAWNARQEAREAVSSFHKAEYNRIEDAAAQLLELAARYEASAQLDYAAADALRTAA